MTKAGAATTAAGGGIEPMHGPIHRASQVAFQRSISERVPDVDPAGIALFVYATGAGRLVDAFLASVARRHDLDGSQFSVLLTLWCAPPPHRMSPTALHRLLVQSPSGMSHTLRRLRAAGVIRRRDDATDGRAKDVELTAKGIRLLRRCMDEVVAALDEVYRDVPDGALDELADRQRQVAELFSRSPLSYPVTSRPIGVRAGNGDGDGDG